MMVPRIAVGGLMLVEQHAGWAFSAPLGVIVGRRAGDDAGVLCIQHCWRDTLAGPLTHAYCLETARRMLSVPDDPVEHVESHPTPCGPYGAATFVGPTVVRRVWYCNRPPGLIVGVYSCPAGAAGDGLSALVRRECEHLMATAVFDRPSWGGDDPLTRVLTDGARRERRDGETA
jgi:hypothetical protein